MTILVVMKIWIVGKTIEWVLWTDHEAFHGRRRPFQTTKDGLTLGRPPSCRVGPKSQMFLWSGSLLYTKRILTFWLGPYFRNIYNNFPVVRGNMTPKVQRVVFFPNLKKTWWLTPILLLIMRWNIVIFFSDLLYFDEWNSLSFVRTLNPTKLSGHSKEGCQKVSTSVYLLCRGVKGPRERSVPDLPLRIRVRYHQWVHDQLTSGVTINWWIQGHGILRWQREVGVFPQKRKVYER